MTAKEIKEQLEQVQICKLPDALLCYAADERESVKKILVTYQKRYDKYMAEVNRIYEMTAFERQYGDCGGYIAGMDEVGRGPLAGPVVTCALILPADCQILYVNDSKKLSEKKREELYTQIMEQAVSVGIGINSPGRIDEINILQATYEAMRQSVSKLSVQPKVLLNDAVRVPGIPDTITQVPIIKGDAKSLTIAAASIVAKVTRDHMMEEYDKVYPGYGFASNKGYGSAAHIEAIRTLGPTPIHRRSFIQNFI